MLEQTAIQAANITAALFITIIIGIALLSIISTKNNPHHT